ncbi:NifU family protein [bacterium]|nr:MAG: NifU family protein [bacterium]
MRFFRRGPAPEPLDEVSEAVKAAVDSVGPYARSHGGAIEFVSVVGRVARVRLKGACKGCPMSDITLRLALEKEMKNRDLPIDKVEAV